jgi:hypothetical protein
MVPSQTRWQSLRPKHLNGCAAEIGYLHSVVRRFSDREGVQSIMTNLLYGVVAGLVFGLISVATMVPLSFPNKTEALSAAFIDRFAIGLVIGCVELPWPGWLVGLGFGVLLSIPSAIITRAYLPIVILGGVGGIVIGGVIHGWSASA